MNKARVVFLRSNPVDPDSRVEKEVDALLKMGYSVEIIGWDRSGKYNLRKSTIQLQNGEVNTYKFGITASFGGGIKKNLLPLLRFQISLYRWLKKNKDTYDIIHACDFDTAFTSSKIAFKYNKKFIYDIFDYYVDAFNVPMRFKQIIRRLDHNIINNSDATIICTEQRKEQIKGSQPKSLTVIHNSPPQIDKQLDSLKLDDTKIKIVYIGILQDHRFLKELGEVVRVHPNWELHIGGFGKYEDYFKRLALENSNIIYYGKLSYDKTLELERSCDIMIAIYDPSVRNHYYAAPNKFYEGLMLGKPLVMAKGTGMSEIVKEHEIGELMEYSIEDLEKCIELLVSRKSEWPEISNKMKEIYRNYSWEKMEARLIQLYKEIG